MDFVKGLMLGLASGAVCAAYCGPILVPYLLSKGQNALNNLLTILYFMGGRLAGYLMFAVLAWAAGLGFLTGLNLCPPFLLAFTEAAKTGVLWRSVLFFAAFFVGTSVYILPLAILGLGRRVEALQYIGRLAAGVT